MVTGCNVKKDNMEGITIYTTIYPIRYLIDSLYGDNSTIYSIYPAGVDTNELIYLIRSLKSMLILIYLSLIVSRQRSCFAVKMINKNKNLKVIDVSLGMTYDYDIAELWFNPYNYLMMAQNTKSGLLEYVTNPYLISNDDDTGMKISMRYLNIIYLDQMLI